MTERLPPPTEADQHSGEMPITGHLIELRRHLIKIFASVFIIFLSLAYFARDLYELLSVPLRAQLPANATMIATDITSTFMAPFKLTFYIAIMVAMPYILHQIWQFVAPALYKNERKTAIPMLISSVLLFYLGVSFAYFVTLPSILTFFIQISPENVVPMTDINMYLSFCLKLFLAFGVTFEIPIATLLLILSGAVSVDSLVAKRRYIIVGCFAIAMFITPPDAMSMAMLAIPMWLLFEVGLLFGRLLEKRSESVAGE